MVLQFAQLVPSRRDEDCKVSQVDSKRGNGFINLAYQSSLGLDKRPVLSIHLIIETTGIAEVVAIAVSPPQRGGRRPAVHTLPAL